MKTKPFFMYRGTRIEWHEIVKEKRRMMRWIRYRYPFGNSMQFVDKYMEYVRELYEPTRLVITRVMVAWLRNPPPR